MILLNLDTSLASDTAYAFLLSQTRARSIVRQLGVPYRQALHTCGAGAGGIHFWLSHDQ